jgi:hypothetical protein
MRCIRWLLVAMVAACTSSTDPKPSETTVVVKGSVQKGPFLLGSSIVLQELDAKLQPTGRSFNVQTRDDLGNFEIPVRLERLARTGRSSSS